MEDHLSQLDSRLLGTMTMLQKVSYEKHTLTHAFDWIKLDNFELCGASLKSMSALSFLFIRGLKYQARLMLNPNSSAVTH